MNKISFPIRLKVLVAVLVILMLVIGVITATMASLFQEDKTAYVRDFSAAVTSNMQAPGASLNRVWRHQVTLPIRR